MNAQERIYHAFYTSKKDRLYFSELKELTRLSNSSLQNILARLINQRIVKKEETKANVFFIIKNKKVFALEFAKIDLQKFESLNRNIRLPLKDFLELLPKGIATILLFGSSSRNKEIEKSDIDLMIILNKFDNEKLQELYEKEMIDKIEEIGKDIQTRSVHTISLAYTNTENMKKDSDHLVNQAIETGFPLLNQQYYHEVLKNEH
jgi:predicted nucleotidyltransferase